MQETLNIILKSISKAAEHVGIGDNEYSERSARSALALAQAYKALKESSRNDDKEQHSPN